ncbi:histone H1-like [Leptopilina heterotoma]|uniref:histone H1-like n=1 Tax=Leptopilina heterotoma TaxID=63436 RepID=UPI001CA981FE|nr:histone H1-like [Leptopilina heterotoma]
MGDKIEASLGAVQSKKSATKVKKPRAKSTHPPTSGMVNASIRSLKERNGSSLQAIKKYIAASYKVDVEKQAPFIKKYLKSAVTNGILVQTKGKGAAGSFKLADSKSKGAAAKGKVKSAAKAKKRATSTPRKIIAAKAKRAIAEKKKTPKVAAKPPKAKSTSAKPKVTKAAPKKAKAPASAKKRAAPKARKTVAKKVAKK